MFESSQIKELLSIIEQDYSMMISMSLGTDILTDYEKVQLEDKFGGWSNFNTEYPPYLQNFLLGRLTAALTLPQANKLNYTDFKKYLQTRQYIPLSERERAEYDISREMTYTHLKGLANKVTGEARNILLEQNKMDLIKGVISEGISERKSVTSVVSDLGHRTGEWDRDWKRIVVTEMQNIYNQGRASEISRKYGIGEGVWKQVFPGACRHCIRLYLTNGIGSEPRIFTLSELYLNNNNIGEKVDDWKPVVGATHPYCRCDIRHKFKGQIWNTEKGDYEYGGERVRLVERKSKIKITVGEKEFFV